MVRRPGSPPEFEARFPDGAACARWLVEKRRADGFRRPGRGHAEGREPGRGAPLVERARCHRRSSVTAGTVPHRGHLPPELRSLAARPVATRKDGMSARRPRPQLGPGSHETARPPLRELRRAMVDPGREPPAGPVEVGETGPSSRAEDDPVAAEPGRSREGQPPVAGRSRSWARGRAGSGRR